MSFYKEVPGLKTTLESTLKFDTTPTEGSTNPVTSDGVAKAIKQGGGGTSSIVYLDGTEKFEDVKGLIDDGVEVVLKKARGTYLGETSYMFARLSFVQADMVSFTAFTTSVNGTSSMVYSLGARRVQLTSDDTWTISDEYELATKTYVDSLQE